MVVSIKREILIQLRRIGLHFEPLMLRMLHPSTAAILTDDNGVGRTFYIDLPNNANSIFPTADKINQTLFNVTVKGYCLKKS